MEFENGMTGNQIEKYNKLLVFIHKLMKLVPDDKRAKPEEELNTILS